MRKFYSLPDFLSSPTGQLYDVPNSSLITNPMQLQKTVEPFYPCHVRVETSVQDGAEYLENAQLLLDHPELVITINYNSYHKRYSIFCQSLHQLDKLTHYDISRQKDKLTEPNGIGVLTTKKIKDHIHYYEQLYKLCEQINSEHRAVEGAFRKSIAGMPVDWSYKSKNEGKIIKNGITFSFKIDKGFVHQNLEIHHSASNDLSTFLKLSDNKLNSNT